MRMHPSVYVGQLLLAVLFVVLIMAKQVEPAQPNDICSLAAAQAGMCGEGAE